MEVITEESLEVQETGTEESLEVPEVNAEEPLEVSDQYTAQTTSDQYTAQTSSVTEPQQLAGLKRPKWVMYFAPIVILLAFVVTMALTSTVRQTAAISTTEEATSAAEPRYITNEPVGVQTTGKTAALDAEPETSATPEITNTVKATHIRPTRIKRPSLRGALVCTVGTKLNRSLALPADGLCDFAFFDSLQRDGVNELAGPFEENFRRFAEHAARHTTTEYGAGFDYHAFEEMDDILSDPATKGHLTSLWKQRIFHFGYLNTPYSDFSHDKFTQLLEILKTVSSVMRDKSTAERPSYTILVAAMHSDLWIKHATHVFRDTFEPDAVVLVGHLPSRRSESESCEILPPTTLVHYGRHASSPSLGDAHETLRKLDSGGIRAALFVSLAMFGRWYKPRYQNPESKTRGGSRRAFDYMQKCRHDSGDVLGSHVQVCRDSAYTIVHHKKEPRGAVAYDPAAGKLLAYDSPESLKQKLCIARSNVTAVKYGFAAFNVEYEDGTNRCGGGAFSRLQALRDLLNAFGRTDMSTEAEDCIALAERDKPAKNMA
ncbi:uncharacterized protein LOC142771944 [Rhipicephalus microplus]|uniref:uncharacterized protein LOC142771944 n=1 Tax=Rhipicephalus microplus TaxID=6941 RepID=UPI003F6D8A43